MRRAPRAYSRRRGRARASIAGRRDGSIVLRSDAVALMAQRQKTNSGQQLVGLIELLDGKGKHAHQFATLRAHISVKQPPQSGSSSNRRS